MAQREKKQRKGANASPGHTGREFLTWADAALKVLRDKYDKRTEKHPVLLSDLKDEIIKGELRPEVESAQLILRNTLFRLIEYETRAGKVPTVKIEKNEENRLTVSLSIWEATEAAEKLIEKKNTEVRDKLKGAIKKETGTRLEIIVANLFSSLGYEVQSSGGPGDRGIDAMFTTVQEFGGPPRAVFIQVKGKTTGRMVGETVVSQFIGDIDRNREKGKGVSGIIVSNSTFHRNAYDAAEASSYPISLIDIDDLVDLLIQQNIGVEKKQVEYLGLNLDELISE